LPLLACRNLFDVFRSYIPEIFYFFSPKHNSSKNRSSSQGAKSSTFKENFPLLSKDMQKFFPAFRNKKNEKMPGFSGTKKVKATKIETLDLERRAILCFDLQYFYKHHKGGKP